MTTSARAEIQDHIARTFEQMGGVGTHAELSEAARLTASDHLNEYFVERGWSAQVSSFFTRKEEDGLPQAPKVDATGTHMMLELMTEAEYVYAVTQYLRSSKADERQAYKLARRCRETLGVVIDIDAIRLGMAS